MPATVIGSRHHRALYLLPNTSPALDVGRLREVLARHGLVLLDRADLADTPEFIAAEDLGPTEAAALADDLRTMGLHARVVNRTALTTSARVSQALWVQLMLAIPAPALILVAAGSLLEAGNNLVAGLVVSIAVTLSVLSAFGALMLSRGGGARLQVTGTREAPRLTVQLERMWASLPEHLAAPLRERVRALEVHAAREPDGNAAAELRILLDELRAQADIQATVEARQLRAQLAQARSAVQETDEAARRDPRVRQNIL